MTEYKELKYRLGSTDVESLYSWIIHGEVMTATSKQNKFFPMGVYNRTAGQLAENIEIVSENLDTIINVIDSQESKLDNLETKLGDLESSLGLDIVQEDDEEIEVNLIEQITLNKQEIFDLKNKIEYLQENINEINIFDANGFKGDVLNLNEFNLIKGNLVLKSGLYKINIKIKTDLVNYNGQVLLIDDTPIDLDVFNNDYKTILSNIVYKRLDPIDPDPIDPDPTFIFKFDSEITAEYISLEIIRIGD